MQRKPSYYLRKSFAAMVAGAAGLVVGIQMEANHAALQHPMQSYFVQQAYASDDFVKFAKPASTVRAASNGVDPARECAGGVDDDCIYL